MHAYSFSTFPGAPHRAFQQPVDNKSIVQWLRVLARLLSAVHNYLELAGTLSNCTSVTCFFLIRTSNFRLRQGVFNFLAISASTCS